MIAFNVGLSLKDDLIVHNARDLGNRRWLTPEKRKTKFYMCLASFQSAQKLLGNSRHLSDIETITM